jgi:hypothetical protein
MNTKLVQSLAQVILSLSEEERNLLQAELQTQNKWEDHIQQIQAHRLAIYQRRKDQNFEISIDDIFEQMRQERSEHLFLTNINNNNE